MKKTLFIVPVILALALSACSTSAISTAVGSTGNSLPSATQLAVGTLKLTGTDQDIATDQAKDLLVYWETYKQLSQSDTSAQAEFDGLLAQIQETMTTDQMQAIDEMKITQQDVFTSMQGVTTTVSSSSGSNTIRVSSGSSGGSGIPAGGPPANGGSAPPDGGGMPADLGGTASANNPSQTQNMQSSSTQISTVPISLVEAVIQSLQQKIAA